MAEKMSCREMFTKTLAELARQDTRILAITSDARGSCSLTAFAEEFPEQFVETGIAEQNEIGIAAGLATVGKRPYVCAPACFLSARSLEQIKVDVAYSNQNVKIFGVSGGVSYGALGSSHHSLHDVAVFRAIPDINIFLPCDAFQARAMLFALEKTDTPAYIRVGRNPVPFVYEENAPFTIGKGNILREGNDLTLIATGETVWHTLKAGEMLAEKGIYARVIDIHTLKPFDETIVIQAAQETGLILTVEEHNINGGLGGAVAQCLARHCPVRVSSIAIPDEFAVAGRSEDVFRHYGLDEKGIFDTATEMLQEKRGE